MFHFVFHAGGAIGTIVCLAFLLVAVAIGAASKGNPSESIVPRTHEERGLKFGVDPETAGKLRYYSEAKREAIIMTAAQRQNLERFAPGLRSDIQQPLRGVQSMLEFYDKHLAALGPRFSNPEEVDLLFNKIRPTSKQQTLELTQKPLLKLLATYRERLQDMQDTGLTDAMFREYVPEITEVEHCLSEVDLRLDALATIPTA
jgi:hypothetical protein